MGLCLCTVFVLCGWGSCGCGHNARRSHSADKMTAPRIRSFAFYNGALRVYFWAALICGLYLRKWTIIELLKLPQNRNKLLRAHTSTHATYLYGLNTRRCDRAATKKKKTSKIWMRSLESRTVSAVSQPMRTHSSRPIPCIASRPSYKFRRLFCFHYYFRSISPSSLIGQRLFCCSAFVVFHLWTWFRL